MLSPGVIYVLEQQLTLINLVLALMALVLVVSNLNSSWTCRKRLFLSPTLAVFRRLIWPLCYCIPIGCTIGSTAFLATMDDNPVFYYCRILQAFGGNLLRMFLLVQCCDRVLATVYVQRYREHATWLMGVLLFCLSVCVSAYMALMPLTIKEDTYSYRTTAAFLIHLSCGILTYYLLKRNNKNHSTRSSVYKLDNRQQIVENIKILTAIKPDVVLLTFMAILAPISNKLCEMFIARPFCKVAIFYSFYNLYFVFVGLLDVKRSLVERKINSKRSNNVHDSSQKMVMSALGSQMPANMTMDQHFLQIEKQWNSAVPGSTKTSA